MPWFILHLKPVSRKRSKTSEIRPKYKLKTSTLKSSLFKDGPKKKWAQNKTLTCSCICQIQGLRADLGKQFGQTTNPNIFGVDRKNKPEIIGKQKKYKAFLGGKMIFLGEPKKERLQSKKKKVVPQVPQIFGFSAMMAGTGNDSHVFLFPKTNDSPMLFWNKPFMFLLEVFGC